MNSTIIISMSIVLLLFIWTWIGLVILNRLSLEKKIEKSSHPSGNCLSRRQLRLPKSGTMSSSQARCRR